MTESQGPARSQPGIDKDVTQPASEIPKPAAPVDVSGTGEPDDLTLRVAAERVTSTSSVSLHLSSPPSTDLYKKAEIQVRVRKAKLEE